MTKPCPPDLAAFKHEPADYEQPVEAVTVLQCDRDAAEGALDALLCAIDPVLLSPDEAEGMIAQAFARHRTQANEAMREALERIAATDFDSPPWQAVEAEIKQIALSALSGDSA